MLHRALSAAEAEWRAPANVRPTGCAVMAEVLATEPLARPDYVSVADTDSLEELATIKDPALLGLAARFPSARLVDCLPLG